MLLFFRPIPNRYIHTIGTAQNQVLNPFVSIARGLR